MAAAESPLFLVGGRYPTPTRLLLDSRFTPFELPNLTSYLACPGSDSWRGRPYGGSPVPSATEPAASWLARRLHAPPWRGMRGRSIPAVTVPRPGRRVAGLSQGSGSSASGPRRRVLRSVRHACKLRFPARVGPTRRCWLRWSMCPERRTLRHEITSVFWTGVSKVTLEASVHRSGL